MTPSHHINQQIANSSPCLFRSLMFVPANNERYLRSAAHSDADILLLDVEDSVPGDANKQRARDNIVKCANQKYFRQPLFPRINDRESGHLLKDLMQLTIPGISGFMCSKSQTGEDVYFIDKLLDAIEYEKGIAQGTYKFIPLIETASAVLHAEEICRASSRIIAIAFGCVDFVADLQGVHDAEEQSIFTARSIIAMAARASGVIPLDTVHVQVKDLEDLEKNLKIAKNLGFEGMLVVNPIELPLVHHYFSPTREEYVQAKSIVEVSEKAMTEAKGVSVMGSLFVGPPMVSQARKTIATYEKIFMQEGESPR